MRNSPKGEVLTHLVANLRAGTNYHRVLLHLCVECRDELRYALPTLYEKSEMNRSRKSVPVPKQNAARGPPRSKKGRRADGFGADDNPALFHFLVYRVTTMYDPPSIDACDNIFSFGLVKAL